MRKSESLNWPKTDIKVLKDLNSIGEKYIVAVEDYANRIGKHSDIVDFDVLIFYSQVLNELVKEEIHKHSPKLGPVLQKKVDDFRESIENNGFPKLPKPKP